MRPTLILALLSAIALLAFSAVPAMLCGAEAPGLSASAATNLNSSRSNIYRAKREKPKGGSQSQGNSPAGLAVSDEGAPGKKSNK